MTYTHYASGLPMRITVVVACLLASFQAQALDWRLGVAYASGVDDVASLYENNLRQTGFAANVDLQFPVGLVLGATHDWASGMRADFVLGPMFLLDGAVDHWQVPFNATIGYNFRPPGPGALPYVRGGLVYHIADGDYYSSSEPGLLIAGGLDFARFSFELAWDFSRSEFETVSCQPSPGGCTIGKRKFSPYELVLSAFWRF